MWSDTIRGKRILARFIFVKLPAVLGVWGKADGAMAAVGALGERVRVLAEVFIEPGGWHLGKEETPDL